MSVRVISPCRLAVALVLAVALALVALSALPPLAAAHGRPVAHAAGHHRHHAVVVAAAACPDSMLIPSAGNLDRVAAATLCLINQQRAGHRLAPLQPNAALTGAAGGHSRDMVARKYFDHVSPSGSTPLDRIRQVGYLTPHASYRIAENIAAATGPYATPAAIVRMWMNSAGHRANILNASYRDTGLGIAPGAPRLVGGGPSGTYTEDFGSIG